MINKFISFFLFFSQNFSSMQTNNMLDKVRKGRGIFLCHNMALREKRPYSELFCSVFSRIWTEYGEILLSLRIQSKCGKMWNRITPNTDAFDAVWYAWYKSYQTNKGKMFAMACQEVYRKNFIFVIFGHILQFFTY